MTDDFKKNYNHVRDGGLGFYEQKRSLIAVWGKEAVQFLNGLITNDVAKLGDDAQMLAAFPNAQGRLLAIVRVMRKGEKFFFETEEATHEKVFQNLFRFIFAGDFFVEDLSDQYRSFLIFSSQFVVDSSESLVFDGQGSRLYFIPVRGDEKLLKALADIGAVEISDELYEVLRIENGVPKYGVDMDETTIVPELGLEGLISYNKGCYIGQEIIARIHFRGHVAKQLTGLIFSGTATEPPASAGGVFTGTEIKSLDDKNAGRITSVTYSPKLEKTIALGYVRYDYLADGTELKADSIDVKVKTLPMVT
jgi:folate-binding protein YgfZ